MFTTLEDVEGRIAEARQVYRARNQRMESLTDESVDTFYSCLLCQSFAPNHVCVITPERLGLCGAYNWLDGKAAYEIDPTGPNQPLAQGRVPRPGARPVGRTSTSTSTPTRSRPSRHSMPIRCSNIPMTSCGCFEAIVALLPECNGVMIVNREYTGETPAGMKFSTLANMAGGGQQVPGFIGVGKAYITSRKFIAAEGGHRRIVWMPRELKEALREDLEQIGERLGIGSFVDLIADESVGTDAASVQDYMQQVKHPALTMWEITCASPEAAAVDATRTVSAKAAAATAEAVDAPHSATAAQSGRAGGPPPTEAAIAVQEAPLPGTANKAPVNDYVTPALPDQRASAKAISTPPDGIGEIVSILGSLRNVPLAHPGAARHDCPAADGRVAGFHRPAPAARRRKHAADAQRDARTCIAGDSAARPPLPVTEMQVETSGHRPWLRPRRLSRSRSTRFQCGTSYRSLERQISRRNGLSCRQSLLCRPRVNIPAETSTLAVRTVTLGGSGTRTSAVTIGGARYCRSAISRAIGPTAGDRHGSLRCRPRVIPTVCAPATAIC